MCWEEANRYTQYTLSVTQFEVVFVFAVKKTRLVHNVCADVVSPQERRNFESLAEIPGRVGHDVHITSPWTPKTKRTLFLEKIFDRNRLIRCQANEDLL